MLVSPDHSQGEALDVAAGLAVLVDPAGVPLGTVQPGRVSVLVSPASKHLACPWIQPTQQLDSGSQSSVDDAGGG